MSKGLEAPDVDSYEPKRLIDAIRKFANDLENLEVEIYEVEE